MTASIQSSLLLLRILAGFQSVLILFQLYLCIMAFRQHRTPVFTGLVTAQFLAGLAFYFVLLEGIYPLYQQGTIVPPSSVTRILGLPWFFLTLAELLSLILCLLCAGSGLRYARSHLSPGSIKRAIDLLPAGICCGEKDGTVCLANLRISELCQTITGHALTNTQRFWEQLLAEGETRNGSLLMRLKDGSVYQFERRSMTAGGVTYDQITASDVTEQYRITAALQERGAQLRDIQLRTKTYHAMAADMVISQEILNARRTVHDGVGHALLTQQYYLEHPEKIDEATLLHLLRQTNTFLLREAEETDDQARDGYLESLKLSAAIGVEVRLDGPVPEADPARSLLGQAIRECAANTVKHACGDLLTVSLSQEDALWTVHISNNGSPPASPIREAGGLLSLRQMVEQAGGTMTTVSDGGFRLTLNLPQHPSP